jgi:hypothetical protein
LSRSPLMNIPAPSLVRATEVHLINSIIPARFVQTLRLPELASSIE